MESRHERLEIHRPFPDEDDLAVDDEALRPETAEPLDDLGKIPSERSVVPAPQVDVVAVAERHAAEPVLLWFEHRPRSFGQGARETRQHRRQRGMHGERHDRSLPTSAWRVRWLDDRRVPDVWDAAVVGMPTLIAAVDTSERFGEESFVHDHDPRDEDDEARGEELEAEMLRADRPAGAESFGTTAEEEAAEEGLDRALAQERPERAPTDEVLSLVDDGGEDSEKDLVGEGVNVRDEFAAPEEAAMSEREDAPGATEHDDPHPDDEAGADEGAAGS